MSCTGSLLCPIDISRTSSKRVHVMGCVTSHAHPIPDTGEIDTWNSWHKEMTYLITKQYLCHTEKETLAAGSEIRVRLDKWWECARLCNNASKKWKMCRKHFSLRKCSSNLQVVHISLEREAIRQQPRNPGKGAQGPPLQTTRLEPINQKVQFPYS